MKKRTLSALLIVGSAYVAGYIWLRFSCVEIWSRDRQAYVLFPNAGLYYLYLQ